MPGTRRTVLPPCRMRSSAEMCNSLKPAAGALSIARRISSSIFMGALRGESAPHVGEDVVHRVEIIAGLVERHHQRRADAEHLASQRSQQMNCSARGIAQIAGRDASDSDLFG